MKAGREIKFRYVFKHPKTKEVQTAIITIDDMERNDWSKTFKWDSLRFELVARQRYTGLRDKNGKEIYEGDIWRNDVSMYVVFWSKEYAGFRAKVVQSDYALIKGLTFTLRQYTEDVNVVEVIGNIYENQELLEVGK